MLKRNDQARGLHITFRIYVYKSCIIVDFNVCGDIHGFHVIYDTPYNQIDR